MTLAGGRGAALRVALGFGAVACVMAAVLNRPGGLEGVKNLVVFPLLGVVATGLLALLVARPRSEPRVAIATLVVFMGYVLGEIGFTLLVLGMDPAFDVLVALFPLIPWTAGMLLFAFLVLDGPRALGVGSACSLCSALLVLAYAWQHRGAVDARRLNGLAQAFVLAPGFTVALLRAVVNTSRELASAQIEARRFAGLALTDELTGLFNRRAAVRSLEQALAQQRRNGLAATAVIVDLDHFKLVNDRHGHDAGDAALRHVAAVFRPLVRSSDTLARWGGEEFLLVCSSEPPTDPAVLCERFRAALEGSVVPGHGFSLTASFGAAIAAPHESAESVVHRADVALYEAKRAGRNRAVIAGPDLATPTG